MKQSSELVGICIAAAFAVVLIVWWGVVSLWQPSVSIMAVDYIPYQPVLWVISLAALGIPLFFYLSSRSFRTLSTDRKVLLLGLSVLTLSSVHSTRCFIDAEIFFCIATMVYFVMDSHRHYRTPMWQYSFVLVYLAWNLVSLAWSADIDFGWHLASNFVPMVLYPAMFLAFSLTAHERDDVLCLLFRVTMVAVLLSFGCGIYEFTVRHLPLSSLIHFRIGMTKETFFDSQGRELFIFDMIYGWSGMSHPSYNSLWAISGAIAGVWLVGRRHIGWSEFLFGELALFALQLSSQSRIGLVMMAIVWASAYVYLLWRAHRKVAVWSVVCGVVVVAAAFAVRPNLLGSFGHDESRRIQWQVAFDYIEADGTFGSGLGGTSGSHVAEVVGYAWPWPEFADGNVYVHNQFLQDWIQSGVVGFALCILMVVASLWMALRCRSYMAFVFTLCIAVFMMIEAPLRMLQGCTIISLFLCLALSVEAQVLFHMTDPRE